MADVRPLRGVRYNPQRQANIGRLIAPPYDTSEPDRLTGSGRLSFNIAEIENVDLAPGEDSHAVAATRYHDWLDQGLLLRDTEPAFYVHDHTYQDGDGVRRRRGVLARVRLAPWRDGVILPHERTFPGPRQERLERIRAVQANLSPLYLLYHDESGAIPDLLSASVAHVTPVATGRDAKGGEHRLTMVTDQHALTELTRRFADERLLVADGHHRYEAALAYRDEQRRADSATAGNDRASDFVLAMLADTADPGVQVLPTHRVVTGLTDFDRDQFRQKLDALFDVETNAALEAVPGPGLVCEILLNGEPGPWRVYRRPGDAHASLLPGDRGEAWRGLDVAISDHVILLGLLEVDASDRTDRVTYTHDLPTAWQMVASGGALALLHARPSLADLARVAAEGDTLPPKSTFFEPKPPAGLVINDLRQS